MQSTTLTPFTAHSDPVYCVYCVYWAWCPGSTAQLVGGLSATAIRRFLLHVLPDGFHRIRHYGLFANGGRADNIARARHLLNVPTTPREPTDADSIGDSAPQTLAHSCPCCGGRMIIIETFERGCTPRYRPTVSIRIDTS